MPCCIILSSVHLSHLHVLFTLFAVSLWTHNPCGPLKPVIALHFSRSLASCTASGSNSRTSLWCYCWSVALCHSQRYWLYQTMAFYPADVSKELYFLCLITSAMAWRLSTVFLMTLLLIVFFQHTFSILLQHSRSFYSPRFRSVEKARKEWCYSNWFCVVVLILNYFRYSAHITKHTFALSQCK